jgi:hypothetical protein
LDFTEQVVTALLDHWALIVGLVFVAVWAMKTFFPQVMEGKKRSSKAPTPLVVQLDPTTSQVIQQTAEAIKEISEVVHKTDGDGTPLVYDDRQQGQAVVRMADILRQLEEQFHRLNEVLGRLDTKFDAHDRNDSLVFSRMEGTQSRIEAMASQNREALILSGKDHQQMIKALDEILALLKK